MAQTRDFSRPRLLQWGWLRAALLLVPALFVVGVSLAYFARSAGTPYVGAILAKDNTGWIVQSVDGGGLAGQAGIAAGDRPVRVNGQPATVFLERYQDARVLFGNLLRQLTVVNSTGHEMNVDIQSGQLSWQSRAELIAGLVVSIAFWSVGFYAFFKRQRNPAALLLCLCGLAIGLVVGGNMAAERAIFGALYLGVAATIIGPWLLVHFFLVLPEERADARNSRWAYLVYLPALVTLVLFPIVGYADGQPLPGFRTFRLFEYGVGFAVAAALIAWNYLGTTSVRTKQQMKIVLIGGLAGLVPVLALNIMPQALLRQSVLPPGLGILPIIFIPVAMGYAVVTQRLMDIDVVIRRGIVYGLVTIVMAAVLSSAVVVSVRFVGSMTLGQEILMALALGGVAVGLFGPAKRGIETLVDRAFYKDRYDYRQIVQGLSASLNLTKDLNETARLVVGTTVQTLNLAGACLVVRSEAGINVAAAQGSFAGAERQKRLVTLAAQRSAAIEFPESASKADPDLAYLIPLAAGGKEVGVLFVSTKASRQDFSSDDAYLLQGAASAAAAALRSALLARDVSARDTFVSVASHELRSPLTSILGFADLLIHKDPPEDTRRKWAKSIFDNSQRISDMVDELLNVSRIRSGRITLRVEPFDVCRVIREQVTMARESTDRHEFVVDSAPDLPLARADREKLGHILRNLLSNAVKYSPAGGRITVSVWADDHGRIVLSVADQGIGIGPEDRGLLFTTFHRIQRPETQNIPGSGLGLYIVKEWTEAMGGQIWLESELNRGSTFFVAVPVDHSVVEEEKVVLD